MELKKKAICWNHNKTLYCILNTNNTLTLGENYPHEGGDIVSPNFCHPNSNLDIADRYIHSVNFYIQQYKKNESDYYNRIMTMLRRAGFEYEPWKAFIKVSKNYLWEEKQIPMTQEEIEKILGYKIKIIERGK